MVALLHHRRRVILAVLCLALLAAAGLYGWRWFTHGRFVETTDNAYVEADISVVSPKVSGYIQAVAVTDNQPVKRGDILLTLVPDELEARRDAAQSVIAVAAAARATAAADLARQGEAIKEASAGVEAALASWQRAGSDLERYRQLAQSNYASVQRVQAVEAEERQARARLRQAEAALATARSQTTVLEAQVRQRSAAIAQAEAELTQAKVDLDGVVVRAGIDGVIGNRSARPGQYVRAGSQLMAIVPVGALYVVANFKETQLGRMRPGQSVSLEVDAYPDQKFSGTVHSLAPAAGSRFALLPAENATGNFTRVVARVPVRIALDPPKAEGVTLAPGLSVVASVDTRSSGR